MGQYPGVKDTRRSCVPASMKPGNVLSQTAIPRSINGRRINNRPSLRALLVALGGFADHDTGRGACPSLATLAEAVQVSPRTVQRLLATLEALGLVQRLRAHSWRLHRPVTWGISSGILREARRAAIQAARDRSARYWIRLQEWAKSHYGASGRQVCHQPSPPKGVEREDRGGGVGLAPPGALLEILSALQNRGNSVSMGIL